MADYIDRGQLLADIENTIRITAKDIGSSELRGARKVIDRIKAMPAADAVNGSVFRDCMNALCMKCGRYKEKQFGACDGCRWEAG